MSERGDWVPAFEEMSSWIEILYSTLRDHDHDHGLKKLCNALRGLLVRATSS
jgi:hypothetical protein